MLSLWDTVWSVFRAPNAIICSAQLHQTMTAKDGPQIEIKVPRAYTQPEGIRYLVGTVSRGRSNFINFWTKIWPAATESDKQYFIWTVFNVLEGQTEHFFLQVSICFRGKTPCHVTDDIVQSPPCTQEPQEHFCVCVVYVCVAENQPSPSSWLWSAQCSREWYYWEHPEH